MRLIIYCAFVVVLWTVKNMVLELTGTSVAPLQLALQEALQFGAVYGAALLLSRIEHCSPDAYGLPRKGAFGGLFLRGCIFGLGEISALVALISLFGGYSAGPLALHGLEIVRWGVEWAVVFILVGLFEEFAFRGYTLHTLAQSVGFWPASFLLAAGFGALHAGNPGENFVGEIGIAAIALLFAFTLRRTGSLWLAVGWHAAFDFGETFLYSVPDSGGVFPGHLSNATLHGPVWLTGGTVGPEGSVFSFVIMGALALAVHFLYPPQSPPQSSPGGLDQESPIPSVH
jgi:uncharacterized protein